MKFIISNIGYTLALITTCLSIFKNALYGTSTIQKCIISHKLLSVLALILALSILVNIIKFCKNSEIK